MQIEISVDVAKELKDIGEEIGSETFDGIIQYLLRVHSDAKNGPL